MDRLEKFWKSVPQVTPLEIAGALRGACGTASFLNKREAIEMVWTGPLTGLVASRHTEQVLLELINSAKKNIFIVSFVAYEINSVMKALQAAIKRNVKINLLLEAYKDHGGQVRTDSVKAFYKHIPSASIYKWVQERSPSNAAVHAKCAVADQNLAFITSANLTAAAMERNMELGVLVRGGNLPKTLGRHLEALIMTKVIQKL